ncbi:hypothetical protein C6497_16815 [Candidatus Poribacteria bacterium]|nr:MAG: hypothetical protein C6497_16815 [Candidatus Poribacteria bacterium]
MKTHAIYSRFNIYVILIVGLCVCSIALAQQKPNENILTKEINYSHVDGGKKLTLEVSKHLGFKSDEINKLIHVLSVSQLKNIDTSFENVTIELLKPANSDIHPKSLVIREIRSSSLSNLELKHIEEIELSKDVLENLNIKDKYIVVLKNAIAKRNRVYIKLHNTTKSRINLKDWQIRITYGFDPFLKRDKDPRIIDIMNYVNQEEKGAKSPKLDKAAPDFIFPGYITLTRKIDFNLLNDPTKTRSEQLDAISDGMKNENWTINWMHKLTTTIPNWVEIHEDIDNIIENKGKNNIIWIDPDTQNRKIQQRIIKPRSNDNLQPIDDR